MITVDTIASCADPGGVDWWSLLRWSLLRQSLLRWSLLRLSLLRLSLLSWLLFRRSLLRQSLLRWLLLRRSLLRWSPHVLILGGSIDNHCWGDCCWDDRCWGDCCLGNHCWGDHCWDDRCWGNCLMCWSWGGWLTIAVETIAFEVIAVEAIASSVDPGGGGELTPSRHSVRSTGWPLVILTKINQPFLFQADLTLWAGIFYSVEKKGISKRCLDSNWMFSNSWLLWIEHHQKVYSFMFSFVVWHTVQISTTIGVFRNSFLTGKCR